MSVTRKPRKRVRSKPLAPELLTWLVDNMSVRLRSRLEAERKQPGTIGHLVAQGLPR